MHTKVHRIYSYQYLFYKLPKKSLKFHFYTFLFLLVDFFLNYNLGHESRFNFLKPQIKTSIKCKFNG